MKLLLDECVDRHLAGFITGHQVDSVQDVGWRSIKTGELLRLAEGRYDVFVTVDRNLAFQQPVGRFHLAIIVLRAKSNDVDDLKPLVPLLLEALPSAPRGKVTWIEAKLGGTGKTSPACGGRLDGGGATGKTVAAEPAR